MGVKTGAGAHCIAGAVTSGPFRKIAKKVQKKAQASKEKKQREPPALRAGMGPWTKWGKEGGSLRSKGALYAGPRAPRLGKGVPALKNPFVATLGRPRGKNSKERNEYHLARLLDRVPTLSHTEQTSEFVWEQTPNSPTRLPRFKNFAASEMTGKRSSSWRREQRGSERKRAKSEINASIDETSSPLGGDQLERELRQTAGRDVTAASSRVRPRN